MAFKIPKHKTVNEQIISLEIERSRVRRERVLVILNKAIFLYFAFNFIGVIGFLNDYITTDMLKLIIFMGFLALIIGVVPYMRTTRNEDLCLTGLLDHLHKSEYDKKKATRKKVTRK